MNQETSQAIMAHAIREFPRECCGLVVMTEDGERYFPCRNIAVTPSEHFKMAPQDYADAEDAGQITCVVHSHPNAPARPSQRDLVACERGTVPWLIVAVWKEPGDESPKVADNYMFLPSGYEAPLIGREFAFGVLDCYSLIKDWYQREQGIELPEFERRDNFWKAQGHQIDLYAQYEKAGFAEVTDGSLKVGDVPLMQIRASFANHAGVYIGYGQILHHLYGQLSRRDVYSRSYYQEVTRRVVRYQG